MPEELKEEAERAFVDITDHNDPLMLELAGIRGKIVTKKKKKKVVEERNKNEVMMSLLLG